MALLGLRDFPFGFRRFLFERREGGNFVGLVVLIFLSRDGPTQFFVGVGGFRGFLLAVFGSFFFFCAVVMGNYFVGIGAI